MPGSLSQSSLTRAKRENGTKRTFEDRKPFLKPKVKNQKEEEESAENREQRHKTEQGSKNLSF